MTNFSVSLRLQRVTIEDAFVSVPLTPDFILEQTDGSGQIDVEAMMAQAVKMGQSPEIVWEREEQQVNLHPLQKSPFPDMGPA